MIFLVVYSEVDIDYIIVPLIWENTTFLWFFFLIKTYNFVYFSLKLHRYNHHRNL